MGDENIREANDLLELHDCITDAQERFASLLESCLRDRPTTIDQYIRYLSFQYHLTRDEQRYFMAIAEHPDLARRRRCANSCSASPTRKSFTASLRRTTCTSSA